MHVKLLTELQHPACLQVVVELHNVKDRLQTATDLLEAQGFSVYTERYFHH